MLAPWNLLSWNVYRDESFSGDISSLVPGFWIRWTGQLSTYFSLLVMIDLVAEPGYPLLLLPDECNIAHPHTLDAVVIFFQDADVLPPGILLVGHALVGYLTTCPLSPLEWKVLFTAICARVALYLILLRVCLPEFRDDLPRVLDPIWNGMPLLRDLLALGEDRVLRSWKAIYQDHGIAVP